MKSIKTSKLVVIMLALVLMVPSLGPLVVRAENIVDEVFEFNLYSTSTSYSFTRYRAKENDTSVYVYSDSMSGTLNSVYVKVWGSISSNGSIPHDRTFNYRNYYYTGVGFSKEVLNVVNERGDHYAALAARGRTGNGVAVGLWSPDTKGSYDEMSYE